ncbi:MAG TPA: carboxypeptidase regulatory-like domain-containing protein [Thermoanaerobaculia bacterium]
MGTRWRATLAGICLLLLSVTAFAQFQTGNIFGNVVDKSGAALPGVTVTLTGGGAPRMFVTDQHGDFRFPSLSPGRYELRAELAGFGTATRAVEVNVGSNAEVAVTLAPAVEQTITVTAETPLLDVRKTGTGATVTKVELEQIPTARDPWVVLQQAPGVLMDRVNVGGNESGQQSQYVGKGVGGDQATWNVDGVNITDMAALGSSPTYYDFDSFEEMQVTTGGSDPRIQTAGVQLNMVTKRGTNDFRGSGRYFVTDNDYQAEAEIPAEAAGYLRGVNEIDNITDMGLEVGGPIIKDRLWLWGAYSDNQIDLLVGSGATHSADKTTLENLNGKLNAQIFENNSATFLYTNGDKIKTGRNAGPTRPVALGSAWNQSGPTDLFKFEDTHIFSPNFFATILASQVDGGFGLTPGGGLEANAFRDENGVWNNGYYYYITDRPQESYRLDLSNFFDAGGMSHELKYGFGYRETPVTSVSGWPGDNAYIDFFADRPVAYIYRTSAADYTTEYTDLYIGDTMQRGNLTLQVGLRYDVQEGSNNPAVAAPSTILPDLLPALSYQGDAEPIEWTSISPRIGATYTFGDTKRTLVRAAYNRYVDQLGAGPLFTTNPVGAYSYLAYYVDDKNGDHRVSRNEILFDEGLYWSYNVDPDNPSALSILGRYDPDMKAPSTDEFLVGFEHELLPEFTVGMNYTHRVLGDFIWSRYEKTQGAGDFYTAADYAFQENLTGTLPNGDTYSVPVYRLKEGLSRPVYSVTTNRDGYEQQYDGIELNLTKRLSNRWMARANLSWNDWTQTVDEQGYPSGDPTERLAGYGCTTCDGIVVQGSGTGSGAKGGVYINSGLAFQVTGLYELPLGFSIGAAINGREGYPIPHYRQFRTADGVLKNVLLNGVESARNEDIMNVDLRLAKDFRWNEVGLTLSVDAFNITDERTVLQRQHRVGVSTTNRILELQSPQVFRVGARLSF